MYSLSPWHSTRFQCNPQLYILQHNIHLGIHHTYKSHFTIHIQTQIFIQCTKSTSQNRYAIKKEHSLFSPGSQIQSDSAISWKIQHPKPKWKRAAVRQSQREKLLYVMNVLATILPSRLSVS